MQCLMLPYVQLSKPPQKMPYLRKEGLFKGAGTILFLNELHSDVTIIVESGGSIWRFPAHTLLLSAMSEVLRRMLTTDLQEKLQKKIVIADISPMVMKQFLRFVYLGESELADWREALDLVVAAHKYQVDYLLQVCEKFLLTAVSLSNACLLHEMAQLYSLKLLQSSCNRLIIDGGFMLLATEGFENLSRASLEMVISNRSLNVENEMAVLKALRHWASAECCRKGVMLVEENLLNIMEPLLQHINFKKIPDLDNVTFLPLSVRQRCQRQNGIGRISFCVPSTLHQHMTSLKFIVELGSFATRISVSEPLQCVKFSVDTNIFIVGFRIVGMFKNNFTFASGNPLLTLSKENDKNSFVHFNLNSLPWKSGCAVGDYVWKEMVAYFPQPARIDSCCMYMLSVKYGNLLPTKWPRTRIESSHIVTALGPVEYFTFGQCTGITELFLLPAPNIRNVWVGFTPI